MYRICSASWARRWPAGLIAASAVLTAPAALGAASTQDKTLLVSAGWHGREIRDPQPVGTIDSASGWPRGWSAGAVGRGAGDVRADNSRRVRELQRRLWRRGCRPGPEDGRFGRRSRSALVWFQRKHDLARTGTVDADTLAAVRSGRSAAQRRRARPPAMALAVAAAAPASTGQAAGDLTAISPLVLVLLLALAVIAAWLKSATGARVTATASPERGPGAALSPACHSSDPRRRRTTSQHLRGGAEASNPTRRRRPPGPGASPAGP